MFLFFSIFRCFTTKLIDLNNNQAINLNIFKIDTPSKICFVLCPEGNEQQINLCIKFVIMPRKYTSDGFWTAWTVPKLCFYFKIYQFYACKSKRNEWRCEYLYFWFTKHGNKCSLTLGTWNIVLFVFVMSKMESNAQKTAKICFYYYFFGIRKIYPFKFLFFSRCLHFVKKCL